MLSSSVASVNGGVADAETLSLTAVTGIMAVTGTL